MTLESLAIRYVSTKNERLQQFYAEFYGSFIMSFIGIGVAHSIALEGSPGFLGAIAGGAGLALGIFASFRASGGHLNPAVTVAHFVLGRMGKGLIGNICGLLIYFLAQFCGMFVASCLVYGIWYSGEQSLLPSNPSPADLEKMVCLYATCPTSTYPNSMASMFFDQVFGSMIVATTVLAVTDPYNANPPGMAPLFIGMAAGTMGLSYGTNAGGAVNSARDFAPRVFASIPYGRVAYTGIEDTNTEAFMWIPFIGPLVGGALAGLFYLMFIMAHWPQHQDDESVTSSAKKIVDTESDFSSGTSTLST